MKKIIILLLFLIPILLISNQFENYKLGWKPEDPVKSGVTIIEKIKPEKAITDSIANTAGLPPVGNQGSQGSCTAWACGYYYRTYLEWEEETWDVTLNDHIFSPAFVYNHINGGEDRGSFTSDAFKLMQKNGCATLYDMPYNQYDYTSWPSESAYENGINYRIDTYYATPFGTDFANLKTHLSNGHIAVFGIYVWDNFYNIDSDSVFYSVAQKSGSNRGGHNITVIGYNDSIVTPDGKGAFMCVNSWGTSWGDSGFWWITYQAMLDGDYIPSSYFYYADDKIDYKPELYGAVILSHSKKDLTTVELGIGSPSSPSGLNEYFDFYMDDYRVSYGYTDTVGYPSNVLVFDLTNLYAGNADTFFMTFGDSLSDGTTGSIDSFFVYSPSGNSAVSNETILLISDGSSGTVKLYFQPNAIACASTNRDSILFELTPSKINTKKSDIIISKKEILNPKINYFNLTKSLKGTLDTLMYDTGPTTNWYGVNYFAVTFTPSAACSLRGIFWARDNEVSTLDTLIVKINNNGSPGSELYRETFNVPGDNTPTIYYSALTSPVDIQGSFWAIFYAITDSTTGSSRFFSSDDDGGGTNSYFSNDGETFSNFASNGYNYDLVIRAEVEYYATYSDTAILYLLNTDPASQRSYSIDSLYTKKNSAWITYINAESDLVSLGDSVEITVGIDTVGLSQGTYYDTLVIVTGADSLTKSVNEEIPITLVLGTTSTKEKIITHNNISNISINPNPAKNYVLFNIPKEYINGTIIISDISGRIIKNININNKSLIWNRTDNSGNRIKNGIYFAIIKNSNNRELKKILFIN